MQFEKKKEKKKTKQTIDHGNINRFRPELDALHAECTKRITHTRERTEPNRVTIHSIAIPYYSLLAISCFDIFVFLFLFLLFRNETILLRLARASIGKYKTRLE